MLRMTLNGPGGALRGWGYMNTTAEAENFCRTNTDAVGGQVQYCAGLILGGVNPFDDGVFKQKTGTSTPTAPAQSSGGFVIPTTFNPFAPTTPVSTLLPGQPGYVAPTPWYAAPTGMLILAGAALVAYKVFFAAK